MTQGWVISDMSGYFFQAGALWTLTSSVKTLKHDYNRSIPLLAAGAMLFIPSRGYGLNIQIFKYELGWGFRWWKAAKKHALYEHPSPKPSLLRRLFVDNEEASKTTRCRDRLLLDQIARILNDAYRGGNIHQNLPLLGARSSGSQIRRWSPLARE